MKIDFVPFQLGMQYENWEFKLDVLPDRLLGFDCYLNLNESLNNFLNVKSDKIEVIFNFDILECVILTFERRTQSFYNDLKDRLFIDAVEQQGQNIINSLGVEDYSSMIAHCIAYKNKTVYLLYCNKAIFQSVFYTLF